MGLRQIRAVTGRDLPRNITARNETMAAQLPALYAHKQNAAWDKKVFNAQEDWRKKNLALTKEQMDRNEKQAKTGNLVSLANTALGAYFSKKENDAYKSALNADNAKAPAASAALPATGTVAQETKFLSKAGAGTAANWTGSLKDNWMPTVAGAGIGLMAGASLGNEYIPFGGKKEKEAMGAALVGGAATYLMTDDIYSGVTGGLLAGGAQLISGWL